MADRDQRSHAAGGNVAARTATASAFADARWPGRLANALGHVETVVYDARFGLPKTVADSEDLPASPPIGIAADRSSDGKPMGQALDVNGNMVSKHSEEAHIPVKDFRFDLEPFKTRR